MDLQQAVDEFLLYLKVEQNYSEQTITSYDGDLTQFLLFLKRHHRSSKLQDLNRSIIRRFIQEQMTNAMNPRTIQRRISTLKSFCKFSLKEQFIAADYMVDIKPPKSPFKLPVYMNMNELRQLLQLLQKSQHRLALRNLNLGTTGFF